MLQSLSQKIFSRVIKMNYLDSQDYMDVKIHNINLIFDIIKLNKGISRTEIAKISKMSSMSITRIVTQLINENLVYQGETSKGNVGRRAVYLHINPNAFYTLTINIDINHISLAVVNLANKIILQTLIDINRNISMEEAVDTSYESYKKLIENSNIEFEQIKCITIVCAGIIDNNKGIITFSAQMKWKDINIQNYASDKFKLDVLVENDVKAAIQCEIQVNNKFKNENIVYLTIGSGVGAAVSNKGKIFRGENNSAGEIGHTIVDVDGIMCECGRKGCLNTILNINSMINSAKKYDKSINSIRDIIYNYYRKQPWAEEIVDKICKYFCIAINNIACSYNPTLIIIGGELIYKFPEFLTIAQNSIYAVEYRPFNDILNIVVESETKGRANLIGGAILAQKYVLNKIFT